jgi:hypothetical protein
MYHDDSNIFKVDQKLSTIYKENIDLTSKCLSDSKKTNQYPFKDKANTDLNYKIILNYSNEEGLIEDFLTNNDAFEDKRKDPNDIFNFDLNIDKWIKLLNKSILMHYEKSIIQKENSIPDENQPKNFNYFDPRMNPYIRK